MRIAPTSVVTKCAVSDARKQSQEIATHYSDVIMSAMVSHIIGVLIVFSINVSSDADQRNYQSSASLTFVRRIQLCSVKSPHRGPVTRKMFSFDGVLMKSTCEITEVNGLKLPSKYNIKWKYYTNAPPFNAETLPAIISTGTQPSNISAINVA